MSEFTNTPPIAPRASIEKMQLLELVVQELRYKNQLIENENIYLKTELSQLKSTTSYDGNNSITTLNDPFVDITSTNICADIETYLEETNCRLTDERAIKTSFEYLVNKLSALVSLQYNAKDLEKVTNLKNELFKKLYFIDEKFQKSVSTEEKLNEIESAYDRLNIEFNAVKATISCKQMIDSNQIDALTAEFLKWKEEIRALHEKVKEQNVLIHQLVQKCEPLIENKRQMNVDVIESQQEGTVKPVDIKIKEEDNRFDYITPGTSPSQGFGSIIRAITGHIRGNTNNNFASFDIIDNDLSTIRSNSNNETLIATTDSSYLPHRPEDDRNYESLLDGRKSLDVYECPVCLTQVSKDMVSIEAFTEHVNQCDRESLSCVFCLKLFKKSQEVEFMRHVQEHE
jgi:hypothetical protein